jgi:carbonic anhydrase
MDAYKKLLLGNKAWVTERLAISPDYFTRTAADQKPLFLWIGCSDSCVPAEDVTSAEPGELFVHRNIANLVVHTDLNLLSVAQYAIEVLKVKHVIVCGHYGCGGVRNAMTNTDFGLLNNWLRHIKDVYRMYRRELEAIADLTDRANRLVELNVCEQLKNLAQTALVQRTWHAEQRPWLHGWVYDLKTGYLKEHALMKPDAPMEAIDRFDFGAK